MHCVRRGLDVHGVGVRHRLDDHRRAAADLDGTHPNTHSRVTLARTHRLFNLPEPNRAASAAGGRRPRLLYAPHDFGADLGHAAGPLRDPGAAGRGRNGGGLPRPGHAPAPRSGDQGPARAGRGGPRCAGALRTGGSGDRGALAPEHSRDPRLRRPRRRRLRGDRAPRGRDAGREAGARAAADRGARAHRRRDLRGAGGGPPQGHRASRPEAFERDADEVRSQAPRLRPGEAVRARRGRVDVGADFGPRGHARGLDRRNAFLHVARAARRPAGRRANRHLFAGFHALRDGDRQAGRSRAGARPR